MKACSVEGCGREISAKNLCRVHYQRFRRTGKLTAQETTKNKGLSCKVDGCNSNAKTGGFCTKHYQRNKLYGNTELPEKEYAKDKKCAADGCERLANAAKGYCSKHYERISRNGKLERIDTNPLLGQVCEQCGKGEIVRKNLCRSCYINHLKLTSPSFNLDRRRSKLKREKREHSVYSEPYTLQEVFDKSCGLCGICGFPIELKTDSKRLLSFTVDHIIPLKNGGADTIKNVQAAHRVCNSTKKDLILAEEKMLILRDKVSKLLEEKQNGYDF